MKFEIDENGTLTSCLGDDVIVRIPEGVKKIGCAAFEEEEEAYGRTWYKPNKTMETVIIPASCEVIGVGAFQYCNALRRVIFSGYGLRKVEDCAFSICKSLEAVELPEGVTEIGEDAFANCPTLRVLILPRGIRSLGNGMTSCSMLARVYYRGTSEEFAAVEREYALNEDALICSCTQSLDELLSEA